MLTGGMTLEYGERVLCRAVYKYKFANVPTWRMEAFIGSHVRKECNLCLYFRENANSMLCFNLDRAHKLSHLPIVPEMEATVRLLSDVLTTLGCQPLAVTSGKGYHLWCRLAEPVSNDTLYNFMLRAMAKALHGLHLKGLDHLRVQARFYPDPRTLDKISLRLFGSEHVSTKVFSNVWTPDCLLDEEASWTMFEEHRKLCTISVETFRSACETLGVKPLSAHVV